MDATHEEKEIVCYTLKREGFGVSEYSFTETLRILREMKITSYSNHYEMKAFSAKVSDFLTNQRIKK